MFNAVSHPYIMAVTIIENNRKNKETFFFNFLAALTRIRIFKYKCNVPLCANAAEKRQSIEYSLVLCHLGTLHLYRGLLKIEIYNYLTNVARIKSTY